MNPTAFCESLFEYKRLGTIRVPVGELLIGGTSPIRVQSMTTTDTNDVEGSIEQSIRIIEAGGQLVRLTTQGTREAESLKQITDGLRTRGYVTPLVADVHFNPAAAETAAKYVEKVRINPGNFTGAAKKFDMSADNMSQDEWMALIEQRLRPLVGICKEHETTLRIGVNHGSLSDRIMAKYGDTPQGMVASCIEYIDALERLDFRDIVVSIKSSNTRVMVQTVRLFVAAMRERGGVYPLHLGVTESGSDAEGRIKSAAGIGALLIDGIGDTIRVSLTEAPEAEIPVAQALVDYVMSKKGHAPIAPVAADSYSPYEYNRRPTHEVLGIGGGRTPVIIADATARKVAMRCGAEFVYTNDDIMPDGGLYISDQPAVYEKSENCYPLLAPAALADYNGTAFVRLALDTLTDEVAALLKSRTDIVVVAQPQTSNPTAELRALVLKLNELGIQAPVVPWLRYNCADVRQFQLCAATDAGLLFIDGLADGLMLSNYDVPQDIVKDTAVEIMQATRVRFSKAEFISCPGCGRTLYDIQTTTRHIKQRFGHLRGLKIGIMGCIVNGIGEMADADYGYVGAGHGKISLYKGKTLVKRNIPEAEAPDELEHLIRENEQWTEPGN